MITFLLFLRFSMNQEVVEATVLEIVKETLNRRQAPDNITRNFLKLLASAAGLVEVCQFSQFSNNLSRGC